MARAAGSILNGRYRVSRMLGEGGMARVYEVFDKASSRRYAVKEIEDRFSDPEDRKRALEQFRSEIILLLKLNHPNIPRVTDYFSEISSHYMVMEFIEGSDLDKMMRIRGNAFPPVTVVGWAIQLCRVLHYLHIQKPPVIFRDIKPSNIILTSDGRLVLVDFGIARIFKPYKRSDTYAMGTEGYAAPEQYLGGGQTDPRSDVYALGATLYNLLTNESPLFEFPRLKEIPADLAQIIRKATDLDPDNRFRSAREMKDALQRIYTGTSGTRCATPQVQSASFQRIPDRTSHITEPPRFTGATRRCNYCNALIRSRSRFCIKCGHRV